MLLFMGSLVELATSTFRWLSLLMLAKPALLPRATDSAYNWQCTHGLGLPGGFKT